MGLGGIAGTAKWMVNISFIIFLVEFPSPQVWGGVPLRTGEATI